MNKLEAQKLILQLVEKLEGIESLTKDQALLDAAYRGVELAMILEASPLSELTRIQTETLLTYTQLVDVLITTGNAYENEVHRNQLN